MSGRSDEWTARGTTAERGRGAVFVSSWASAAALNLFALVGAAQGSTSRLRGGRLEVRTYFLAFRFRAAQYLRMRSAAAFFFSGVHDADRFSAGDSFPLPFFAGAGVDEDLADDEAVEVFRVRRGVGSTLAADGAALLAPRAPSRAAICA